MSTEDRRELSRRIVDPVGVVNHNKCPNGTSGV